MMRHAKRPASAEKPEVSVKWISWRSPARACLGHGVAFYDVHAGDQEHGLVAFLEGFDWLHGGADEAVIRCVRPNRTTTAQVLEAMKERVEAMVSRRQVPSLRITDRIEAVVNG
jgi:hypothetical protein